MSTTPNLHIPILYGSQTGNSQACAESLAESLPKELYKTNISSRTIDISSSAQQLDDFLEVERAAWPRFLIIITSSYGVGQAPLGCWTFRDLCDAILEKDDNDSNGNNNEIALKGVKFAMLGLGDSKYSTFFLNPTALDTALSKAGAERIGLLGKADASGVDDNAQSLVMKKWCHDIITEVSRVVKGITEEGDDEKQKYDELLKTAKDTTCAMCNELFDDWETSGNDSEEDDKESNSRYVILIVILAVVVAFLINNE